jgi:hypothetical protein
MVDEVADVQVEEFDTLVGDDAELENDLAFQNLIGDKETEEVNDEPEEEAEEPEEEAETTETTETETQSETTEEIDTKGEFVFDKSKYEEQGIKDETTLKILEKQDKELWNKDKLIGRQGQKMGDMRKDLETKAALLQKDIEALKSKPVLTKDEFNEKMMEDPDEATRLREESNLNQAKLLEKEAQYQKIQTSMVIEKYVPEFNSLVKDIAEILKEDIGPEYASKFVDDPLSEHPGTALNLARVVLERRKTAELTKEVAALKKQLESSPKATIDKLKNVGKNTTTVTTSTSSGEKKKSQSGLSVELLSDSDLDDEF